MTRVTVIPRTSLEAYCIVSGQGRMGMGAFVVPAKLKTEFEKLSSPVCKTKGTVLFRRGDPAAGLFLVRKGKVKLELDSAGGIYPARTLGPGSVAGLPASVSGAAYSLTAKVAEDCELGYIPREKLIKLLGENSELCFAAMQMVSREISRMRARMKVYDKDQDSFASTRRHPQLRPAVRKVDERVTY